MFVLSKLQKILIVCLSNIKVFANFEKKLLLMAQMDCKKDVYAQWLQPKLSPLKYSRDFPMTQEWVERYYNEFFWEDLRTAYEIDGNEAKYPLLFIFKSARVGNVPITFAGINHYHMFSQGVFFVSLCPQVVGRLYGWDAMTWFMTTSKQPMITCFMAGLRHPLFVMRYAELFPLEGLETAYVDLLNFSSQYFLDKISKYLVSKNVEAATNEMLAQVELLKQWVNNPAVCYPEEYVVEPRDL
jgi:hypothetical protein